MGATFNFMASDVGAPDEKPKNAVKIEVRFPRGTIYNRNGAVLCSLPEAMRTDECPRESLLGKGSVAYNFRPFGDTLTENNSGNLRVFHANGGALRNGGLRFFLDWTVGIPRRSGNGFFGTMTRRGVLTIYTPELSEEDGPPGVLTRLSFRIRRNAQMAGTPLLRTPARCNPDTGWKTKTVVTYEDDSTETLFSKHRCHRR